MEDIHLLLVARRPSYLVMCVRGTAIPEIGKAEFGRRSARVERGRHGTNTLAQRIADLGEPLYGKLEPTGLTFL